MSNKNFLLEVGCEEIPSQYMPAALKELEENSKELLQEKRLPYGKIKSYGTPRRMVLWIEDLAEKQEKIQEKLKGPSCQHAFDDQGTPTKAAYGFARSSGVDVSDLIVEEVKGAQYLFAIRETPGEEVYKVLPGLLEKLLSSLRFSRSMYWQRTGPRFIRPIRWLLCLYQDELVPFSYAGLEANKFTYGHRFLAPGPWEVKDPDHYFLKMEENWVMVDPEERRECIANKLKEKAWECQGSPLIKEDLLEEVNYLVEYPEVIWGRFSESYLKLPQEVLITTMEVHQRYFPVVDNSGEIKPYFLGVSNNLYTEYIKKGYQKVLDARLADAEFFYQEDLKRPLEDYVHGLKEMLFQEKLGTLYDKTLRVTEMVRRWGRGWKLDEEQIERAARAAYLCKADLLTNMVGEFPELQGIIGEEYALQSGEKPEVALALREHYLPRFAEDALPKTAEGALVSVADKMDTLAGCFKVGIQPSGSQDPYALRRQAQGIINVILESELDLFLDEIIQDAFELNTEEEVEPLENDQETRNSLRDFIEQRIRYLLQDKGISYSSMEALLAVPYGDIPSLFRKAQTLEQFLKNDLGGALVEGYTRVNNLARKADASFKLDASCFQEETERILWQKTQDTQKEVQEALKREDYKGALESLAGMKPVIDQFFDEVMVMTEEESSRRNRLSLLVEVKRLFNLYAEFSYLTSP